MTPTPFRQIRYSQDPATRLKAARALGESDDIQAVPWLIRSVVEDPDPQVRQAARESLQNLIGAETDLALKTYRASPEEDAWLVEPDEDEESEISEPDMEDDLYLSGLVTVLRSHADAEMRLKAIRQLQESSDLRVIAALSETVLWTDDETVREAARSSLEARFGEGTEEIIQSYQMQDYLEEEQDDDEDEEPQSYYGYGLEQPPSSTRVQRHFRAETTAPQPAEPVSKEEGTPWLLVVIGVVGVIVMVIVVLLSLQ